MSSRRKKGTGSITLVKDPAHKNAPWKASYPLPNGKRSTRYFSKEAEAKKWLRNLSSDASNLKTLLDSGVTYNAYAGEFLEYKYETQKLKPRSLRTLEQNVIRTSRYVGDYKLRDINNDVVQDMVHRLSAEGYSRSIQQKSVFAVTATLRYAASKQIINVLPIFDIDYPVTNSKEDRDAEDNWLRLSEMNQYVDECCKTYVPKKYAKNAGKTLMVHDSGYKLLLLLHTGMRLGEALALTWDKYDEYSKTILIDANMSLIDGEKIFQSPKTSSGVRLIVLNQQAHSDVNNLRRIFDEQTKDLYFRKESELRNAANDYSGDALKEAQRNIDKRYKQYLSNHKYICGSSTFPYGSGDPHSLNATHNKIVKRIGIDHVVTLHGLRHTYVTNYYLRHKNDDDFDLPTFSKSIGHKDVRTTMTIYAHLAMTENRHIKRDETDLKVF